ncbi:hypothetical protein MUK42_04041 [Musa troglodytarum]|uniref:Uncharacterized protein n=1 Tax=Musa troglodytarum TaxID=320322 RepID=A0A9E7HG34_9LILI|nr:hypothetical protein MUK42_04041 [Musa troglodytarum]
MANSWLRLHVASMIAFHEKDHQPPDDRDHDYRCRAQRRASFGGTRNAAWLERPAAECTIGRKRLRWPSRESPIQLPLQVIAREIERHQAAHFADLSRDFAGQRVVRQVQIFELHQRRERQRDSAAEVVEAEVQRTLQLLQLSELDRD